MSFGHWTIKRNCLSMLASLGSLLFTKRRSSSSTKPAIRVHHLQFFPNSQTARHLARAHQRGVRVTVIYNHPSQHRTHYPLQQAVVWPSGHGRRKSFSPTNCHTNTNSCTPISSPLKKAPSLAAITISQSVSKSAPLKSPCSAAILASKSYHRRT